VPPFLAFQSDSIGLKGGGCTQWTEVFGSERLTGALLDRLTHHVHILEMNGESYRLAQSRTRKRAQSRERPKSDQAG